MQLLNSAKSCGMPKLLACCEYYIATEVGLPNLLGLKGSLPGCSALRIIAALRVACSRTLKCSATHVAQNANAFYGMAQSGKLPGE